VRKYATIDKSRLTNPYFRKNFPWSLYWLLNESSKARLHRLWYHLNWGGWVWPSVYIVGALVFTQYTSNPLMWITFNQVHFTLGPLKFGSYFTYDHFWDLLLIAGLTIALAIDFNRRTGGKLLSFGLIATWGSWLMWSQHEGLWWVTDVLLHPSLWIYLFGFGALLTFATVFIFYQFGYFPWRSFLWIAAYYVVWAAFGFHVTVDYTGPTAFYTDPGTFAWEIGSWLWAGFGFYWLERRNLLNWYNQVRALFLSGRPLHD
jgi:hypothetical protein